MTSKTRDKSPTRIRVGITGHRPNRMPERHWPRIRQDLATIMADIEARNPGRKPVLLSGLAEGADRLAAFVALGRSWTVHAVLPFHRTRFEEDFPDPAARGEFRALLAAAAKIEEPGRAAHVSRPPEEAYDAVGQKLLAGGDILIAIWDGQRSRGRGGTVEVIEQARARGIPVVWISARKPAPPRHLQQGEEIAAAASANRAKTGAE